MTPYELLQEHAVIAGVEVIPASCGGLVEVIDWLVGIHDDAPSF